MITVPLPFSLGTVVYIDPVTGEEIISHPVLDIGSSYSTLKQEIIKWLKVNSIEYTFLYKSPDYIIIFTNEQEAMQFSLLWL